eukprot:TRINITY_DN3794_c0_g1_i3.p1 TRINITY_DN3794_c0_g1~~TRINITY_DN3794_c0_g1_i3.p1  ORF type:complete len:611 (+),score=179.10 TRINITY_DN3794_c0_g1_i3:47-1879(+)
MRRTEISPNVQKVYNMLTPKPKPLLENPSRKLVRHGELIFFSTNTMSTKPRYFYLFSDCLLITKRTGQAKFLLRLWMYLKAGVQLYSMPDSPNHEFRILIPVQGSVKETKKRRLIIYAKTKEQKDQWVNDIAHCLWGSTGKKGPDPSKTKGASIHINTGTGSDSDEEESSAPVKSKTPVAKKEAPAPAKPAKEKIQAPVENVNVNVTLDFKKASIAEEEEDPTGGENLIVFDLPGSDGSSSSIQGVDSTGRAIPLGVQLPPIGGAGAGAGAGTGAGMGAGVGVGLPYPYGYPGGAPIDPNTGLPFGYYGYPIDPVTGLPIGPPIDPATGLPIGAAIDPTTGLPVGYAFNPLTAGSASGYAGGVGPLGASGVGLGPADPNFSLLGVGKDVSDAVNDLLKNTKASGDDNKLDEVAAKELAEATATIEAITKQLQNRPRKAADKPADAEITMDDVSDAILNATQAIAKAATSLLKAASNSQADRVKGGKELADINHTPYHTDPLWAEGLISASRYVVATTQNLVETADKAIVGNAKEETLVASARSVSAATAQLVSAQRAKGDLVLIVVKIWKKLLKVLVKLLLNWFKSLLSSLLLKCKKIKHLMSLLLRNIL